ncbi:unnamed protein product [Clavelina lepadiformis]|uniref:Uncharacterized protein n=1 Tax=Clavelina lepadiformis TaxID=159417 RepID=A0ABP0FTX6_CLALP
MIGPIVGIAIICMTCQAMFGVCMTQQMSYNNAEETHAQVQHPLLTSLKNFHTVFVHQLEDKNHERRYSNIGSKMKTSGWTTDLQHFFRIPITKKMLTFLSLWKAGNMFLILR